MISKKFYLKSAMAKLTEMISNYHEAKKHMQELYEEYSAHKSPEANYVKSLDLFDCFLQAFEYELLFQIDFSEFWRIVPECLSKSSFFEPQVKGWLEELLEFRENKINLLPKDSNLNTLLRDIIIKRS